MFLIATVLGVLAPLSGAENPSAEAVANRYRDTYRAYQQAIEQRRPFEEIHANLQTFLAAKAEYQRLLGPAKPLAAEQELPETAQVADQAPAKDVAEPPLTSYPTVISRVVDAYRQVKSGQAADKLIRELEDTIARNPEGSIAAYARYELGKAYENLKKDPVKAAEYYRQVAADPDSTVLAALARRRLASLQGQEAQSKWKTYLGEKYQKAEATFQKFLGTSWVAFPVKISRFFTYFSQIGSFKKAQSDQQDFMLQLEELRAPFVGSLDDVFSEIEAVRERGDESGIVRLLNGNSESWFARWKLMSEARESIDIQYFIIDTDAFGMAFLGLLHRKAKEGVKIRFMTDARGSNKITHWFMGKDYLEELAEFPNVEVKIFNRLRQGLAVILADIRRIISSNHDKIIVVDGRYSIVGGRNIANEYLADQIDDPTAWRDCDIVIDSPGVARELQAAFTEDFENVQARLLTKDLINLFKKDAALETAFRTMDTFMRSGSPYTPNKQANVSTSVLKKCNEELRKYPGLKAFARFQTFDGAYHCPIRIIDKGSLLGPRNDITDYLVRLIDASRSEIILQNPYVVLTPRAEAALKRAGKRQVRVLFHTNSPATSDSFPTEAVMMADWRGILSQIPTSRIFAQMGKGQLHAKTFVFDGEIGVVGTYNLDYVSEQINSEVIAALDSPEFSKELRAGIIADLANSKEYRLATADSPEFGPDDVDGKNMWLIRLVAKMKFLRPLF